VSELARELQRRQKNQEQFAALLEGYNELMSSHQRQQSEVLAQLKEYTNEFERLSNGESAVRGGLVSVETEVVKMSGVVSKLERTHIVHTEQQSTIYSLMVQQNKVFEENIAKLKVLLLTAGGVGFIWFIAFGIMISFTVG